MSDPPTRHPETQPLRAELEHELVDRMENILQRHPRWREWYEWWMGFHRQRWEAGDKDSSVKFFKACFGRQSTTVVFRHRNWVWHRPTEGWTLYVDKRGPALCCHRDCTPEEAWAAFERFRTSVDPHLPIPR